MNALESPLEALAFNYLTYGFLTAVNNLWAWLAFITAAVSFWRIRALSSPTPELSSGSQDAASTSSSPPKMAQTVMAEPANVSVPSEKLFVSAPITRTSYRMLETEGGKKTKFSLYYDEDDFMVDDDRGERDEDSGGGGAAVRSQKWRCDDWERMMVLRKGDMGLYRWQDTTMFDGSVVRLWEWRRRKQAASLLVDGGVSW